MNVLSLFDGMSCGQIALTRANIHVDRYYASEIDEKAIAITQRNYPDTIQLGDVENWQDWDIDWASIDLIMGGSPCQGFSNGSWTQTGPRDERSRLFFVFVDILNHVRALNPNVKFLLENVSMKPEWLNLISDYLGVRGVYINSDRVSAQNRQRYYWANWDFSVPADRGIKLEDIIEDDGYYADREKSYCLDANYYKGSNFRRYFFMSGRQILLKKGYVRRDDMTKDNSNDIMHEDGNPWRKLSVLECERLQTVPEGYTAGVSNVWRYHMLGNGWTVDVITHILKSM